MQVDYQKNKKENETNQKKMQMFFINIIREIRV